MKTPFHVPQPDNPLLGGLKQLVREAVREELQNCLIARNEPEPLLLDIETAARFLSVPQTWLATMAREKKIKSLKLGHYVRFARTDLEEFILRMKDQGQES
jgi:excisionase family DNA binding protein